MPPAPIALCADDFGISPAVNAGILEAVAAGRLTAVSCMTGSEHFGPDGPLLNDFRGHTDVGIHLTLTDARPIGPMPALVSDGRLPTFPALLKASIRGRLDRAEIAAEFERQIDAFLDVMKRPPDFIDGHHHVHQLPHVRDAVLEVTSRRLHDAPVWIRACDEPAINIFRRNIDISKALAIGWFGRSLRRKAALFDIPCNTGFSGIYDLIGRVPYVHLFETFIRYLRPGALVMCHPGRVDQILRDRDSLTDQRETELEFLLGPRFGEALAGGNVELMRLSEYLRKGT